jgi:hypothetical protein
VIISIKGNKLANLVARGPTKLSLFLPWDFIYSNQSDVLILDFQYLNPARPADYSSGSSDRRELSIALNSVALTPLPHGEIESPEVTVDDSLSDKLELERAARLERRLADERASSVFRNGNDRNYSIRHLLESYACGDSAATHDLRKDARSVINARLRKEGVIGENESAFEAPFHLRKQLALKLNPAMEPLLFDSIPSSDEKILPILPSSARESHGLPLTNAISSSGRQISRGAFGAYFMTKPDVFVHPYAYQVYDRMRGSCRLAGSPQGLSKIIERSPTRSLRGNLVIAQDWFTGTNFAHFLFDWATRVAHFVTAYPELKRDSTFIFGGTPSQFHHEILRALCSAYDILPERLIFPRTGFNIRVDGEAYWFSDQMENGMHPGQLLHPLTIEILSRIAKSLDVQPSPKKRIYISRADASMRRVENEKEILELLSRYDFVPVTLGDLPIGEQFSIIFGADVIVAPHGMGLTHIALHPRRPIIVELFNPLMGSDAYATVAHARGFPYRAIFGEPANNFDFTISVESLRQSLAEVGIKGTG